MYGSFWGKLEVSPGLCPLTENAKQLGRLRAAEEIGPLIQSSINNLVWNCNFLSRKAFGKILALIFFSFLIELSAKNKLIAIIRGNIYIHTLRNE